MPPLSTFDKTLVAIALSQASIGSNAETITVSQSCSLANAIRSANQSSSVGGCTAGVGGVNEIALPAASTISLTTAETDGELGGDSGGLPLVTSDITIHGNGATVWKERAAKRPLPLDSSVYMEAVRSSR